MADVAGTQALQRDALAEAKPVAVLSWNPSDGKIAFLFTLPTMALLVLIGVFPLIWSLYLSFTDYKFTVAKAPGWVGIGNFQAVSGNVTVWNTFVFTAKFVLLAVSVEFLLGFGIAFLLNRSFPGRGLITTIMLLPMMLSPALAASFWKLLYSPNRGGVDYYLKAVGIPITDALVTPTSTLIALAIVDIWQWTPFMLLISLAGLSAVPRYLYEAAEVDQASGWFRFTNITFPLVWPLLLIALIFRTMDAVRVFEYPAIITADREATQTIATFLYRLAFRQGETGFSTAFAYMILVMIIAMSSIYVRNLNKATGK